MSSHAEAINRNVLMANQIAKFFRVQGEARAVPAIAQHIRKFWDPRMRADILAHLEKTGGEGLDPLALQGVHHLAKMK